MKTKRSLEEIVDEQVNKWNCLRALQEPKEVKPRPVITISREPGTGGNAIAIKLAEVLKMDFMSGKIIQEVAQSTKMSGKVVASLDERRISLREDWLKIVLDSQHLWPDSFLRHLMTVVSTIGRHGNAIILGRGANFILPPKETFRVRLIAPKEARIARAMSEHGVSRAEAEEYVTRTESDRKAFVTRYFHTDIGSPYYYDMVIDTSRMGIDGTVEIIKHAYNVWARQ